MCCQRPAPLCQAAILDAALVVFLYLHQVAHHDFINRLLDIVLLASIVIMMLA